MGPNSPNMGTPAERAGEIYKENAGTGEDHGYRIPI